MLVEVNSISELSDDQMAEVPFEVTREEYIQQLDVIPINNPVVGTGTGTPSKRVGARISNLLQSTRRRSRYHVNSERGGADDDQSRALQSVHSDNGTSQSLEGIQSLTYTIASNDTVKASNTTTKPESSKKKGGWSKLKRMIGVKTAPSDEAHHLSLGGIKQTFSFSSSDASSKAAAHKDHIRKPLIAKRSRSVPQQQQPTPEQAMADDSIRGRLDGVDVIALGGAQMISTVLHPEYPNLLEDECDLMSDLPHISFVGDSFALSPGKMMFDSLRQQSEIILDGFVPGVDDRWSVRIEKNAQKRNDEDGGSPALPTPELWRKLWGSGPPPASLMDREKFESNDDPVMTLAAECAVPIDVDEDTFMVSTREHLSAIHEIAAIPLQAGNFELALGVFYKLLKGLDGLTEYHFLKGTTLHNIGMVHLWQGQYQKALTNFSRAVEERVQHLPKHHPDVVVSMVRKGLVLFALGRFDESIAVFEVALPMIPRDHIIKAKVRNNLGVVYYHQRDFVSALKEFTGSLEIQRTWLETSVRREKFVFDAATTLSNMGRVYLEQSEWEHACSVYEEALLLQTTIFRRDTDIVLQSLLNLALAQARAGNVKKALQILHGNVRSKNARFGPASAPSIETIGLMGYFYSKRGDYGDAMKCLTTVKKWQKTNLPADHPACQQTEGIVSKIEAALKNSAPSWV